MTGVILVVDDVPANVKLLEAKLTNEYYDVITAKDGFEAIEQTVARKPDLILLDVMMPGMDGFETCRKIKENPEVAHIPIVMVTALSEMSDRLQGLEAGADDFITKPINDTALFARVKSLVRIKVLIDELRLRDQSGAQLGLINEIVQGGLDVTGAQVVLVDDDAVQSKRVVEGLSPEHQVAVYHDHNEALEQVRQNPPDLIIISTMLMDIDGLRLATQFKAIDSIRNVPIVTLVDEDDTNLMLKALELGVNDYLVSPVDSSEMAARVRTQLRRKKYQDALKSNYKESVSMAITDALTGLYNRHYLDTHLKNLAESSLANGKNMSVVIMDMDHFKHVNDNYGHDVGDEVLRQLATRIVDATRSSDLVARFGGEEFVVLMPETDFQSAYDVAERIRASIEQTPFKVSHEIGALSKTLSIGVASLNLRGDEPEAMLKRADTSLYVAKNGGRNQVQPKDAKQAIYGDANAAPQPAAPQPAAPPPAAAPAVMSPQQFHAQPPVASAQASPAPMSAPTPMAASALPFTATMSPAAPPVAPPVASPATVTPAPIPAAPPASYPAASNPQIPPTMSAQGTLPPPAIAPIAPVQPLMPQQPPLAPAAYQTAAPVNQPAPPPVVSQQPQPLAPVSLQPMRVPPMPSVPPVAPAPPPQPQVVQPDAPPPIRPVRSHGADYKSPIDDEPEGTF